MVSMAALGSGRNNQPMSRMHPSLDDVRELFRHHDLRCTRQRELVYTALAATTAHPTADELYQSVHAIDSGLSLATVYNTLEAFIERGLTRKISNGLGPCRYDADISPHVHMSTSDGRVVDVPIDISRRLMAGLSPELINEIEERMGVKISQLNVQVVAD
jgi:Fe2+ or Zn2+ uptake regulation protein